jgi:hypothetical protein
MPHSASSRTSREIGSARTARPPLLQKRAAAGSSKDEEYAVNQLMDDDGSEFGATNDIWKLLELLSKSSRKIIIKFKQDSIGNFLWTVTGNNNYYEEFNDNIGKNGMTVNKSKLFLSTH